MDTSADASAMIGHLLSIGLVEKLLAKRLLTSEDLREIADDAALTLETFQSSFPERHDAFVDARKLFDGLAQAGKGAPSNRGTKPPPTLRDPPKR